MGQASNGQTPSGTGPKWDNRARNWMKLPGAEKKEATTRQRPAGATSIKVAIYKCNLITHLKNQLWKCIIHEPSVTFNLTIKMVESKTTTSLCTKLCVAYTIIIALISIGIFAWYTKSK